MDNPLTVRLTVFMFSYDPTRHRMSCLFLASEVFGKSLIEKYGRHSLEEVFLDVARAPLAQGVRELSGAELRRSAGGESRER